jgi:ribosomal-protein-alanine N-acetyltransferase
MKKKGDAIDFRPVNGGDVDEVYELLNDLTEQSKHFFHPHLFDRKTIVDICSSGRDHYFIMTVNGKIVGYSMLRLFGYSIPSFGCCIRNGYERRGYGTMLTRWTLEKAKELGYTKVILKVYEDNIIAFRMYKKIGFTTIGKNVKTNEIKMAINL